MENDTTKLSTSPRSLSFVKKFIRIKYRAFPTAQMLLFTSKNRQMIR